MGYSDAYPGGYSAVDSPVIAVEIAFATDPFDTPTWVDVSDWTMSGKVTRGRSSELDRIRAGTATVELVNDDRRFDPTHTTGPYYPNVLPMRRLRIQATYGGTTHAVFTGFIDRWEQSYEHPGAATATVTATDAFKVLAARDLPVSAYAYEVAADGPTHWWRFDEQGGTVAYDQVGDRDAPASGTAELGAQTLIARDGGAALGVPGDGAYVTVPAGGMPTGAGAFTVEFVIQTVTDPASRARIIGQAGDTGFEIGLGATVFGATPIYVWLPGGSITTMNVGPGPPTHDVGDGSVHHIAITRDGAGSVKIWFDGEDRTSSPVTDTASIPPNPFLVGSDTLSIENPWIGTLDEVAVYDYALSSARIADHAAVVNTPWDGDTSGERIERILETVAWPAADTDIDTGESTLGSVVMSGSALAYIQKVEESEGGLLFIAKDGKIRFRSRHSGFNLPIDATFGDGGGAELEYIDISFDYSEGSIYNEIRVSRSEGTAQTAEDATSQTRYGIRTRTIDGLLIDDDAESRDRANFLLGIYKDPVFRTTRMVVQPAGGDEASLYPQVLGRELGDKVRVRRKPQDVGSTIDQAVMIEGIRHQFADMYWRTEFMLSPVSPTGADTEYLQLDDTDGPGLGFVALAY